MKKFIIGLIAGIIITSVAYPVTVDQIYSKFGPKLVHAVVLVIKDEINLLRAEHSLSARTNQQLIDAVNTELSGISDYDWMQ